MKDKILDIIANYPRHYSKMIKNDSELKGWVELNASNIASTFPKKIYTVITNDSIICSHGNKKQNEDIVTVPSGLPYHYD